MSFSRLTIKTAIQVATKNVTVTRAGHGWIVKTVRHDRTVSTMVVDTNKEARDLRKLRRIFVALFALGIDETVAAGLATAHVDQDHDWRRVVRIQMERLALTAPK